MQAKPLIAPSLLSANFANLRDDIAQIEGVADVLHLDVMDGHYVPNISFGIPVISSIRKITALPFDVHLMIEQPEKYIHAFAEAGADMITCHVETVQDFHLILRQIREEGKKPGISIHPDTPVEAIYPYLSEVDLVLVMSVRPGFGGQAFMAAAPERIHQIREELDRLGSTAILSVDGGIDTRTAPIAYQAGATMLVAGSAVFGKPDINAAVEALRSAAIHPQTSPQPGVKTC